MLKAVTALLATALLILGALLYLQEQKNSSYLEKIDKLEKEIVALNIELLEAQSKSLPEHVDDYMRDKTEIIEKGVDVLRKEADRVLEGVVGNLEKAIDKFFEENRSRDLNDSNSSQKSEKYSI